jgi:hypothetical protein
MARDFDRGASCVDSGSWSPAGGRSRPFAPGAFAMTSGLREGSGHSRLTQSVGRVLLACEQKLALDLKEGRFDRARATKSPQQTC